MANAASTIEIELEIRQAINRLDRLQRELTQSTQSFNKAAQATRKFEGAINKAKAGLVAFFAAISIQKLAQLSDAMTQFENRVKLATNSLVQQLAVQQQLFQVAQKTALPLEDVGQLYSRLRIAAEQLGASQRDLINLTETVGLALKASGTSAASAQGALLQLGQALNSPRVQAEEFNSLIDGMPNLLREVEKQLGLTAGGLKKFVTDGQLSNKKFFDAILASQKALTQQANSSASTIEQANQRVANSFTSLIGAIDDKLGASKFFTGFIDGLASGIDKLSNFLGLTTQATGGRGANLDQVIRGAAPQGPQYAFPTIGAERVTESIGRFPNYVQEINSLEELKSLEIDLLFVREDQAKQIANAVNSNKETIDILGAQNVPLKEAQGYLDLENKLLDSIIQKRKIELQQNEENLTYLEQATNYLKEQFDLNDRTAGAIISGVSGAGPNASRATNIAQSKTIEEAAAKLILSNEKVAAAIDKSFEILFDTSFEILFDTLDPFIDILGDLISSINKLIGALVEGVGNAIERNLDAIGLGPNSYYGGGGFTRDIEALGGGATGGAYQPTASEALQIAAIEDLRDIVDGQDETLNNLLDAARESGNLTGVVELFKQSINNLIPSLVSAPDLQTFTDILDRLNENVATGMIGDNLQEVVDYYQDLIDQTSGELPRAEAYVAVGTAELIIQELASQISGTGTSVVGDFEGISDLVTKTAQEQIDSIHFQNLTAEEQIDFRNEETVAMLNAQKIFIQLIDDEERRADLLTKIAAAEAKQLELYNLQLSELQKLNEERERELNLERQNNLQSALIDVFKDFEKGLRDISEIIDGLNTQINDLLFSDFNLAPASDSLEMATETYADLFAAALDPEATEEDVKAFQGFVDTYLRGARDVFKSSTAYRQIFDQVLVDLQQLGLAYGQSAPVNLIENIKDELESLETEFGTSLTTLIQELDRLGTVFANQSYAYSGVISVDLGTIDTTFDSSEFNKAIDSLNVNIANGITSLIRTLDASKTALDDFNSTGSVSPVNPVPTESTDLVGLYGTGSTYSTLSGFNPLKSNLTGLSGGPMELISKKAIYSASDANELIQTIVSAQIAKYGGAGNIIADTAYAAVSGGLATSTGRIENTTIVYGAENQSDLQSLINSILNNTDLELVASYNLPGFRYGGLVDPMDTIPAMLSPGEYILSPETVRRYGVSNLNRLNAGDSAAINATSDPEVKRLLAELIVAVRENDTEVNVYTDMQGQTKASIEEFRSELRERTRRQGDKFLPARYI